MQVPPLEATYEILMTRSIIPIKLEVTWLTFILVIYNEISFQIRIRILMRLHQPHY
jgi:hypothetical protein